jgi:hypothetical protein
MATEAKESGGRMRISDGQGHGRLKRFVLTLAIITAIVLVTGSFAVRTQGGRDFMESRLEEQLGFPVSIENVRIAFPYTLVYEGVLGERESADSEASLKIGELRVCLARGPWFKVRVFRAEVNVQRVSPHEWRPAAFVRMGDLPFRTIAEIARLTEGWRDRCALEMRDCAVRWVDMDGGVLAQATGVSFDVRPVRLPRRRMYAYALNVYSAQDVDGTRVYNVEREWLASTYRPYVEIYRSGQTASGAGGGFWDAVPVENRPVPRESGVENSQEPHTEAGAMNRD